MGRPADDNLPEVVPPQPYHSHPQYSSTLPEVVPDSSPEAGHPPFYTEQQEKYPAQYDNAPKYAYDQHQFPPGTPGSQYQQQQWGAAGDVSAVTPASSVPWQRLPSNAAEHPPTVPDSEPEPERRILGMRRRLFFIVAGILGVVVIAAAVGGGVGSAVSSRSGSDPEPAEETSSSSTISATSTTTETTSSTSTTTSSSPTSTADSNFLPDIWDTIGKKQYAFQGFSEKGYKGKRTPIVREEGFYDFDFEVVSYYWYSNLDEYSNCCNTACVNSTLRAGWWCDSRNQTASKTAFSRLYVWCGREDEENQEICKDPSAKSTSKSSDSSASILDKRRELGFAWLG